MTKALTNGVDCRKIYKLTERVEFNTEEDSEGIRPKKLKGTVVGFSRDHTMVRVKIDGNKVPSNWSPDFWLPMEVSQ